MRKDVNGDLEQNSIYLASSIIVAVSVRRWLNLPGKITQENHSGKFNSELKYCLLINESSSVLGAAAKRTRQSANSDGDNVPHELWAATDP